MVIAGHAFLPNLRRGHYELGVDARHGLRSPRRLPNSLKRSDTTLGQLRLSTDLATQQSPSRSAGDVAAIRASANAAPNADVHILAAKLFNRAGKAAGDLAVTSCPKVLLADSHPPPGRPSSDRNGDARDGLQDEYPRIIDRLEVLRSGQHLAGRRASPIYPAEADLLAVQVPFEDGDLVPEREDLGFFGAVAHG
jgi:hypothetical protein